MFIFLAFEIYFFFQFLMNLTAWKSLGLQKESWNF